MAHYQAGICFEPENEADFIAKLTKLKADTIFYDRCKKGCNDLAQDFDRIRLAYKFLDIMTKIVASSKKYWGVNF